MKRYGLIALIIAIIGIALFVYLRFYYVFGEGVKAGQLNQVMKKGYIFKTYEGKMIQAGFRSRNMGTIESYEFEFSIEDHEVARRLMMAGGRDVELHYKEYFGAAPWRGNTKYIVDSIVAISNEVQQPIQP